MALGIYTEPTVDTKLSSDGTGKDALSITIDGRTGGEVSRKLYVRNDSLDHWYSSITISTSDSSGRGLTSDTYGFWWKLKSGEDVPSPEEWNRVSPNNSISLSNIGSASLGDTITYLPFWVRVKIPRFRHAENITSVTIDISATENFIDL